MQDIMQRYYGICQWITRLLYVNFLWIAFSLFGLLFLGFFPSTTAMFSVVRRWINEEHDIPIFRTFWQTYKADFVKANILGYILFIIGFILYIDLQVLGNNDSIFHSLLNFIILGLFLIYIVTFIYIFPLFAHIDMKVFHYFKWSIVIGVTNPIFTLIIGVCLFILFYMMTQVIPGLIFLFCGSTSAFIIQWVFSKIIPKFTVREEGGTYGDVY